MLKKGTLLLCGLLLSLSGSCSEQENDQPERRGGGSRTRGSQKEPSAPAVLSPSTTAESTARSAAINGNPATMPLPTTNGSTTKPAMLDDRLVVVAKAIGKHRGSLAGWSEQRVKIIQTLRGHNATGDVLAVQAKEASWSPGEDYVLVALGNWQKHNSLSKQRRRARRLAPRRLEFLPPGVS